MYRIMHKIRTSEGLKGLELELGLEDIDNLHLHEETKPKALDKLKTSIGKARFLWHPIIVDRDSKVILDGMHRATALKVLGFRYIPCLFVDVMHPSIKLNKWDRIFLSEDNRAVGKDHILNILKALSLSYETSRGKFECIETEEAWLDSNGMAIALLYLPKENVWVRVFKDTIIEAKDAYDIIGEIERRIATQRFSLEHVARETTKTMLREHEVACVMFPRRLSKTEVINVASEGKVFIPKATRFVLPVRVMFMNVPINLLMDKEIEGRKFTLAERNEILEKILIQKNLYKIRGKIFVDRHYDEPCLYIFE